MTLNDLGRAVFESVPELKVYASQKWGDMDNDSRRVGRAMALAAVERFAEEANKIIDGTIEASIMASLSHGDSKLRIAQVRTATLIQDELKTLLSSLRDEAGQKGGAT